MANILKQPERTPPPNQTPWRGNAPAFAMPHDDTISERVTDWMANNVFAPMGFDPQSSYEKAQNAETLMNVFPPYGAVTAGQQLNRGDAFAAANFIPGAKGVKGVGSKLVKGVEETIKGKTLAEGAEAGREALAKIKAPKQEAITAVSLREMPLPQAIESAQSGRHIIPKTGGGFVGAPHSAQSQADIDMIRQKFDADVEAGAAGADWYPRAQEWIKQVAGNDPARQSELARNLALFSAQADPKGNLGFSITARNNAIMNMTPMSSEGQEGVVRTGQQWRTYKDAYDEAPYGDNPMIGHNGGPSLLTQPIKLGKKTGIYAGHMDPTQTNPTTGTNDIWHARALGYETPEGKPWESALTAQQHAWMDAETVLAVDRANKAKIGGRSDWTPGEIQAAPWVTGKGRGLVEKSKGRLSEEEGMAEAAKTYPDHTPFYTGYGQHEAVPGKSTGHLPNITFGGQQVRDDYSNLAGSFWKNNEGKDIPYEAQKAYVQPTRDMVGLFDGDINIGQSAQPLVSYSGPSGRRVLEPASYQLLRGTEALRGVMDAQDAAGSIATIPGQKMSHANAFKLSDPASQSREGVGNILKQAEGTSMPNLVNTGSGGNILTNFDPDAPTGVSRQQKKEMLSAFPGAEPVRREGTYVDYTNEWKKGVGSDAVTRKMLGEITDAQQMALDTPEVRQAVLAKFDRDRLVAAKTGGNVRPDLQNLREDFAKGGFELIKSNLSKGLYPAAAFTAFMPYLAGGAGGPEKPRGREEG